MAYYSLIDSEQEQDSNFDALIEYQVKDFKDFSEIAEKLSEFRKQVKSINCKYNESSVRVKSLQKEIQNIDDLTRFHPENAEWIEKVTELKNMYLKLVNYDEEEKELKQLDEQKSLSDLILNEFKVQVHSGGVCILCSENLIGVFLDPCGHVCCQGCWDKTRGQICPCCRAQVTVKKMFLI
jgi:hypothetical protein